MNGSAPAEARRPRVAFFGYHDVFEDFFAHYGVTQEEFCTSWRATGSHAEIELIQRELADVTWYEQSVAPRIDRGRHQLGFEVRMLPSSLAHRALWRAFYEAPGAWRWSHRYRAYELIASYLAPLSVPLARAVRADRPDLLLCQDYATGRFDAVVLLGRLLGVPVAARHSGSAPGRYSGRTAKRFTIRRADRLLVSSREEARMLSDEFGVDRERVAVLLSPVDTELFSPRERAVAVREVGLDPERRYVVFVGRLDDRVKRVTNLIRAFGAQCSDRLDVQLVIAGDGPDAESIRAIAAAEAPDRVRFLGWLRDRAQLAALLNAADLLALPSRHEGAPMVIGEAMACGTAVLATRVGGISEMVVPGETGWLVEPDDDRALSEALGTALSDPVTTSAFGVAGRRVAEARLAPDAVAARLRELLPFPDTGRNR